MNQLPALPPVFGWLGVAAIIVIVLYIGYKLLKFLIEDIAYDVTRKATQYSLAHLEEESVRHREDLREISRKVGKLEDTLKEPSTQKID